MSRLKRVTFVFIIFTTFFIYKNYFTPVDEKINMISKFNYIHEEVLGPISNFCEKNSYSLTSDIDKNIFDSLFIKTVDTNLFFNVELTIEDLEQNFIYSKESSTVKIFPYTINNRNGSTTHSKLGKLEQKVYVARGRKGLKFLNLQIVEEVLTYSNVGKGLIIKFKAVAAPDR